MGHGRQQTWRHVCTIHLQHFLPDSAWENHFPPLSQPRPQKCEKMLLGNLACTMIMGFFIFWYSTPKSLFLPLTNIALKRPVKIFWNCCQGSKYGLLVKRTKRDRILISMFACWATLSMWHKPLSTIWSKKNSAKQEWSIFLWLRLDNPKMWRCAVFK